MKRIIITLVLCSLWSATAFAREQSLLARVTVYWASGGGGSDAGTRGHQCSTGERLRTGHCAVDPKRIPYGSKVIFPDATCVAVDTGRDVINRKAARRSGEPRVNVALSSSIDSLKRNTKPWPGPMRTRIS